MKHTTMNKMYKISPVNDKSRNKSERMAATMAPCPIEVQRKMLLPMIDDNSSKKVLYTTAKSSACFLVSK